MELYKLSAAELAKNASGGQMHFHPDSGFDL